MSKQALELAKQLVSVLENEVLYRPFYKNGDLPHQGDTISHQVGLQDDWLVLDIGPEGRVRAQTFDRSSGKFYKNDSPVLLNVGEYYLVERAVPRHKDGSRIKVGDLVDDRRVSAIRGMEVDYEQSIVRHYVGGEEFQVGDVAQNQKSMDNWIIASVNGAAIKGYPQAEHACLAMPTHLSDPYKLIRRANEFDVGDLVQYKQLVGRIVPNVCFCDGHYTVQVLPALLSPVKWWKKDTVLLERAKK